MSGFKDFTNRVANGEVKGTVQPPKRMGIEEYEEIMNEKRVKQFERERKEKEQMHASIVIGVILAIVFSLMTNMIIESITFAVVITFFLGVASNHYS